MPPSISAEISTIERPVVSFASLPTLKLESKTTFPKAKDLNWERTSREELSLGSEAVTKFAFETEFIQANFKFGTNFEYTTDVIRGWIANHFQSSYELKPGEILTVPSYIDVKDKVDLRTNDWLVIYDKICQLSNSIRSIS